MADVKLTRRVGQRTSKGTLVTQGIQNAANADQAYIDLVVTADNSEEIANAFHKSIMTALEEIGLAAEGYAKKLCPVDTGRLRNSITHAISRDEKAAYVGTNVHYGPYVEYGNGRGYDGANGGRGYLRPAATDHGDTYRRIMDKALRDS